jgi:hypothetical protein
LSATDLACTITLAAIFSFTIMICTSLICSSRERIARDSFDPRSDDELARDVQRALREQGRR